MGRQPKKMYNVIKTVKMMLKDIARKVYNNWFVSLVRQGMVIIYRKRIRIPCRKSIYNRLKKFQNIHQGERCFIIATAPSLTLDDVNLVKGEITFSMNSCFKLFEKTDWRPTYYCILDHTVYERIKNDLDCSQLGEVFVNDYINWNETSLNRVPVYDNWGGTSKERKMLPKRWQKKHFSTDISQKCYYGTSVMHFIMQICFYMGFKEIYLLGADCDFSGAVKHSKLVSYKDSDKVSNPPDEIFDGLMGDYALAKKEAECRGIKIYNATRGGKLELFDRVKLEELDFLK